MSDITDVDFEETTIRNPMRDEEIFQRHIARLRSSLSSHGKETICEFITKNTKLRGRNYSFKDHEYQEFILKDKSKEKVIPKSAQMGISEMMSRASLAMTNLIDGFSTIYTLPSASAAQNFMKTRVDPVIHSSAYLSEAVSKVVDNTMIKRFGESYLYLKGAQVDSQAISVPADMLIADEVDNSNQEVLTLFESRLIHSLYQYKVSLSTPTVPGYGIDLLYKQSRRFVHMCKCCHCNAQFEPDYFLHMRIPGFLGDIDRDINKNTFANPNFRWQEAYIACPKCGLAADLGEKHREWVCENPDDNYVAAGFRVSPFSCPNIILPSAIVRGSVGYKRKQDFYNQRLGIAMEDKEATLTEDELRLCFIMEWVSTQFPIVMGLDMGTECACTIAAVLPDDVLVILHTEMIPMQRVYERRKELVAIWRVRMCVVDHGPYTETVYRMQQDDCNVYAGVYVRNKKSTEIYKIKEVEEDKAEAVGALRQVNISRDKGFDYVMGEVCAGHIKKLHSKGPLGAEDDELWIKHCTDMKRIKEFDGDEEIFVWRKVSGDDHYHHSLLYATIASKILGVAGSLILLRTFVSKIRVTNENFQ